MFWLFVFGVVASEVFAVNYLKKYTLNNSKTNLFISHIFYFLYAIALGELFKMKKIATSQAVTGMLSLITITGLGFLFYKEKLTEKEMLGMAFALISIFLLL